MKTRIVRLKPGALLKAAQRRELAQAVRQGLLLVFPTDTVYGIGTTALLRSAMRRIYLVKRRDSMKPLPILVHSVQEARRWTQWTPTAEALARSFWPGPLTLVLKPTKEGRALTSAEQPTLAVRVPGHAALLDLIRESATPWASTSANISGLPASTDAETAVSEFDGLADFILAEGACAGRESSVVDACGPLRVLREGALSRERLERALDAP